MEEPCIRVWQKILHLVKDLTGRPDFDAVLAGVGWERLVSAAQQVDRPLRRCLARCSGFGSNVFPIRIVPIIGIADKYGDVQRLLLPKMNWQGDGNQVSIGGFDQRGFDGSPRRKPDLITVIVDV